MSQKSHKRMTISPVSQIAEIAPARLRLARHLAALVAGDGALRDRCASRITESALLLVLLRKENVLPEVQRELVAYLGRARPDGPLERAIAHGLTGRPVAAEDLLAHLDGFQHFTGLRKQLLLEALMHLLGLMPDAWRIAPRDIEHHGHAVWTQLTLCSAKILHAAREEAAPNSAQEELREFLVDRLTAFPRELVWEGNALAHLIALHALHTYRPGCALLHGGINALVLLRNPDGGMPFVDGQELFMTALAGTALAQIPDRAGLVSRMADYVVSRQREDGGWGYNETTTQTDVDDTARCLQFLRAAGRTKFRETIGRAEAYLERIADPGGGFSTYVRGRPPSADVTAAAVSALPWADHAHLLPAAVNFLIDAQRPDGSFEPGWTLSESSVSLLALDALARTPLAEADLRKRADRCRAKAVAQLRRTRQPDGGWGHDVRQESDVLSTAQAVAALAWHAPDTDLDASLAFLLARQHPNGGFTSIPDQTGPRPLPYDFPAMPDIQVLNALNRLTQRQPHRRDAVQPCQ